MIDQVEERLRESLRQNAARAPQGYRMLPRVRLESRRRRRRREATLAALAAAVLLGGVFGASIQMLHPTAGLQVAAPDVLRPGGPDAISFPFTPQRALVGSSSPVLTLAAGVPTLMYNGTNAGDATVTVRRTPPDSVSAMPISVRGHAGSVGVRQTPSGPTLWVLSWPERPDMWVEIRAPKSETLEDLTTYALALRAEPMTQALPFMFDLVPVGLTMDNVNAAAVTFAPPDVAASEGFNGRIVVMLDAGGSTPVNGRLVSVEGRNGWLSETDGYTVLHVDNRDGRILTIQMSNDIRLSQVDLIRFAAGIHVRAEAQAVSG